MIGQRGYRSPPQPNNNSSQQTVNSGSISAIGSTTPPLVAAAASSVVANTVAAAGGGAPDHINNHNHHPHPHHSHEMQLASSSSLLGSLNPATMMPPQPPNAGPVSTDRRPSAKAPHPSQPLKCPRCDSLDTKFCYYNNYSLTQPRYFCKNCKRYWTAGGALRNVPVGGGLRKNKRTKLKLAAASASSDPDGIAAAQVFAASQKPPSTDTSILGLRRPEKGSSFSDHVNNMSGSAVPATIAGLDHSSLYPFERIHASRIRNDIGMAGAAGIDAAQATMDYVNSSTSSVDQKGMRPSSAGAKPHLAGAASVFYGAEPRQFYSTAGALIGPPASVSGQQTAADQSGYGVVNGYNFLAPPNTAAFRHHMDTGGGADLGAAAASANHHSVDASTMLSTMSLCTTSMNDNNMKQDRSSDDQTTATSATAAAASSVANSSATPYDWQQIMSEGLFNVVNPSGSSDGFLYQLPGASCNWPDFSDQFNDTGPG